MTNRPLNATDFDDGLACDLRWVEHHIGPSLKPVRVDVIPEDAHLGDGGLWWSNHFDREGQ